MKSCGVRLRAVGLVIATSAYVAGGCTPARSADEAAQMTVGCELSPSSAAPSQPPRPLDAAPVQYHANQDRDPSTFVAPARVFAKLGVSETTTPLKLKRCRLERWFQSGAAQSGMTYIIDARRMVYEVVTTFDFYEGRGGAWGPGFRTFVIDAATGDAITTTTGGHVVRTSLPQPART